MEYSAFDKVPEGGRTFSYWDQAVFWFSACSLPAAWTYGALMAGWQGLTGALFLIFVVNTLSFIPWAYLGEIAAKYGASSIAIVRPAFGIRGSIIPSISYLILGFGWAVVNVFLGAIALSFIFKLWLGFPSYLDPDNTAYMVSYVLAVCLFQGVFAVAGHEWIKKLQWAATVFFLVLGIYQTYLVFSHWGVEKLISWKPAQMLTTSVGPFVYSITLALLIDLLIAYNWTWEFIGDFSRFAKTRKSGIWGPFIGANIAQYWWFLVGVFSVIYLAHTTGNYNPLLADPSSSTVALGLGWLAALVVLFSTITTNAANLYASALGISNMFAGRKIGIRNILKWVAVVVFPISLSPLLSKDFVGFYIFFLDFIGAIVVPLWTLTLVDYFILKRRNYHDDIFRINGGRYWYKNGWNWPAILSLAVGTLFYWVIAYGFIGVRQTVTATVPTIGFVSVLYMVLMRRKIISKE